MYDSSTDIDSSLRVGDADREATAERLRHHHAEGRIDIEEFQQRLDRCYQATTAGQLQELVADLPSEARRPPRYFGPPRLIPMVPILLAVFVVAAVTGGGHGFLFLFLLFPLTRLLLFSRRGWSMRGSRWGAGRQS